MNSHQMGTLEVVFFKGLFATGLILAYPGILCSGRGGDHDDYFVFAL